MVLLTGAGSIAASLAPGRPDSTMPIAGEQPVEKRRASLVALCQPLDLLRERHPHTTGVVAEQAPHFQSERDRATPDSL